MSSHPLRFLPGGSQHVVLARTIVLVLVFALDLATTACNQGLSSPPPQANQSADDVLDKNLRDRVHVEITPATATLESSRKMQFTARVTNTRNPGVTWTASAGSISSSGLFTAPLVSTTETVIVTATSKALFWARASVPIIVTEGTSPGENALDITTRSIPAGTAGAPYTASVAVSGGQLPYEWSIASGSLPQGMRLDRATGTISGMSPKIGTFPFIIRVTSAAAAQATQQNFTLQLSPSNNGCGPPTYNCSRTDINTVQLPNPVPNVGNLTGANTTIVDPDFNNPIVRVTDASFDSTRLDQPYFATSGSGDENIWNTDSTLLLIVGSGGRYYPVAFDPTTMEASRLYSTGSGAGMFFGSAGTFSYLDSQLLYVRNGTKIQAYDFTDRTHVPTPQTLFDFKEGANCLPLGYATTWGNDLSQSKDDLTFVGAFSNGGGQGTGVNVVVWRQGQGCSALNTQTGVVTGDWGVTGTVAIPDRFSIHNVKISRDGNWVLIASTHCFTPCTNGSSPYAWQVGTTNLFPIAPPTLATGGHWTEGYTHFVNNSSKPYAFGEYSIRTFAEPALLTSVATVVPIGFRGDGHAGWSNVDQDDTVPFFITTTYPFQSPYMFAWENEVIAMSPVTGQTWRFAHTFDSSSSAFFSVANAIGSISQDGRFFAWASDWMGTLGSTSGASACTLNSNCRGDVFVVELK